MHKRKISRSVVLIVLFSVLFLALIARLFYLQIVRGEDYAENFKLRIKREITLPGARGTIYDRNGRPLAVNQLAWSVTVEDQEEYRSERERQLKLNSTMYKTAGILKEHGDSVENVLEIRIGAGGEYEFTAEGFTLDRFRADVYGRTNIEDMDEQEKNSTAEEIVEYLADRFCIYSCDDAPYTAEELAEYGLPEPMSSLSREELLEMLSMRYALSLQSFQKYLAVTVAKDVSNESAAEIMERRDELSGVNIQEDSIRVYEGGEACAPILGYTGKISSEELEEMDGEELAGGGYTLNSVVGKSGMEQYLEKELQGTDGKQEVYVDNLGRITQDLGITQEAKAGKDVYLTIDLELQQKTYDALERKIADILLENLINAKTFDKTAVADASEIKIPVYDVYIALITNGLIDVSHFQEEDASETERTAGEIFAGEKERILQEIRTILGTKYSDLSDEMKEYTDYIVDNLDILSVEAVENNPEISEAWGKGEMSLQEYLYLAIEENALNPEIFGAGEGYLLTDEMYGRAVSYISQELENDSAFDKLVWKYLVLEDKILPEQICTILYDQGVLGKQNDPQTGEDGQDDSRSAEDKDYTEWQQGSISTYELIRRKIDRLEITPGDLALDPCSGSAVVTDTETGEVLACVSYPGYDNNRLANQMDDDYYYRIYNNASLPLYNRATQQLSAPGSTFKPVSVIAGLEEGVIDSGTSVDCDGVFDKVAPALKCWNTAGHGSVTSAAAALQNSCNDYLCEISYRLGMMGNDEYSDDQALGYLQEYAKLFNLDKKSGIELPESKPQVTDSYAIPSAIGQGTNNFATVQLARYAAALANGGTSFRLSLIDKIDGAEREPEIESTVELSSGVWDAVHTGMEWYIQSTGIFEGCPVSAAGKSGTAQEVRTRPDHGLFIGYAPADNPEIAVAVRITNGYDAAPAVECGREIFETYFRGSN